MATGGPLPSADWNGIPAAFSRRFIELSQGSAEAIRKRGIPVLAAKGTMDTAFERSEDYPALVRALGADSVEFPGLNHFLLTPGATGVDAPLTEALARWMLSRLEAVCTATPSSALITTIKDHGPRTGNRPVSAESYPHSHSIVAGAWETSPMKCTPRPGPGKGQCRRADGSDTPPGCASLRKSLAHAHY